MRPHPCKRIRLPHCRSKRLAKGRGWNYVGLLDREEGGEMQKEPLFKNNNKQMKREEEREVMKKKRRGCWGVFVCFL